MLPIVKSGENSLHVTKEGVVHSAYNLTGFSLKNIRDGNIDKESVRFLPSKFGTYKLKKKRQV